MSVAAACCRVVCGFDEREQHRERLFRLHRMAEIRGHVQERTGAQRVNLAIQTELALAGQNLDQRVLRGSVLAQFLTLGKPEQDRA